MAKTTVKKSSKKKVVKKTTTSPAESVPSVAETTPATVVETPASTTTAPTETVTETPAPVESKEDDIDTRFASLFTRMSEVASAVKSIQADARRLQKDNKKLLKEAARKNKKKGGADNPNKPKRAPSGFAKPSTISTELCKFLGRPEGTQMARTSVTKEITKYIKDHNLQNPANKRHILPDKDLKKLLNVKNTDEVTYFNLQKYMKHHFPKTESVTVSS